MKASPLQIPGRGIRPPNPQSQPRCPNCNRNFVQAELFIDPLTKKVILICPYCKKPLK
jgi:hypothetical protein